jgi:betaine lipid synthase
MIGNCSPKALTPTVKETELVPSLEIGAPAMDLADTATIIDITSPLSSFHYQTKKVCVCMPALKCC